MIDVIAIQFAGGEQNPKRALRRCFRRDKRQSERVLESNKSLRRRVFEAGKSSKLINDDDLKKKNQGIINCNHFCSRNGTMRSWRFSE